ncbi:cytochrome P450 2K1-like [Pelobates fuscus]|uniref:cytochrome P450 2K1-like n=1 Tax=Pelobates fuscus TaxID=191477 RepID=UPI002FE44CFC
MDTTYLIILAMICILTLLFLYNVLWDWKPPNYPPGPKPLPLIGNLNILDIKRPYLTLMELSKQYGSVFSIQMGMNKMVVLTGYETVKDALVNHADEFGERPEFPIFHKIDNGAGLIFSRGENWKVMRRFTLTTLRDFGMGKSSIEEKIIDECDHLVLRFQSFNGKSIDNTVTIISAIANIIVSIILGHRMEYDDKAFLKLMSLTVENIKLVGSPMISLYNLFPNFVGLFPGSHKTVHKNIKELNDFITETFVTHLKELDVNDQRSFIDAFLIRQKEEENNPKTYYHNVNLMSLIRNLFAAGMDTTAMTLRWGLLLMLKHPDIQEKVHDEISRVIGSTQPRYDHRLQMPYTNAVIHEIQRFANIVPMNLPHETTKDVNFKGYFIPKGITIVPLLYSVLRDKTQFAEPEKFNPNHFLDARGSFVKKDAFMPFSAGRRVCAGENLARMELFLFFTSLLQKFNFCLPPGVTDADLTPAVGILTPPLPYKMCAIPRA